jgi:adenylate kinase family enzyme
MKRVVILGPRGSGKSTLAKQLGQITGLPIFELDRFFWGPDRLGSAGTELTDLQKRIAGQDRWIIDGDLGFYDCAEVRLRAADTIIFLDFSPFRCVWRLLRQPHGLIEFWRSFRLYRRRSVMEAVSKHAYRADFHVLHDPTEIRRYLVHLTRAN